MMQFILVLIILGTKTNWFFVIVCSDTTGLPGELDYERYKCNYWWWPWLGLNLSNQLELFYAVVKLTQGWYETKKCVFFLGNRICFFKNICIILLLYFDNKNHMYYYASQPWCLLLTNNTTSFNLCCLDVAMGS